MTQYKIAKQQLSWIAAALGGGEEAQVAWAEIFASPHCHLRKISRPRAEAHV